MAITVRRLPRAPARLRLLAIADLRVQSLPELIAWVRRRPTSPDLLVYAGDDVDRFRPQHGVNYWTELAGCATYGLVAVRGNDDDPRYTPAIVGRQVVDLGRRSLQIGRFAFHGVEGVEDTPEVPGLGWLRSVPETITRRLERGYQEAARARTHVVVAHSPPRGVLDAAVRFSPDGAPRSIGSTALRAFVVTHPRVRLVCVGHCHRMGGRHAPLGEALVINAASHDDAGARARVAEVDLAHDGAPRVRWHELRLAPGFEGLPGLGAPHTAALRRMGIVDTRALARAHPTRVATAITYSPRACIPFVAAARAVTRQEPIVHAPCEVPPGPRILLDIETDLRQRAVWMVGMLDEATGAFRQLVARRDRDEPDMLTALADELTRRGRPVVSWSGSRFDERVLCQAYARHGLAPPEPLIDAEDVMLLVRKSIALPVQDLRLGTVATWCGFRFRHPELDGFMVGMMCSQHRARGTRPPPEVRRYNEDDVRGLAAILARCDRVVAAGLTIPRAWERLPGPRHPPKSTRRPLWPLPATPRLEARRAPADLRLTFSPVLPTSRR